MKNLNLIDKIVYVLNGLFAAILLLAYLLPYVPPKTFSSLSVLSLSVPVLLVVNGLFLLYWLLKVKKQLILSLLVLILGCKSVSSLYKFSSSSEVNGAVNSLSLMSYNVRLFNLYDWIDAPQMEKEIENFVLSEAPDVLAFQEYHPHKNINLSLYPYKYESLNGRKTKYGQAIYSKYKIVGQGDIKFAGTHNKAIYVDILKHKDTIRVYNVHFESLHINPDVEELSEENTEHLIKHIGKRFEMQQDQAALVLKHQSSCRYKKIVLGDFNNTAYSYIYKQFKEANYKDTFELAGNGFGRTFNFKFFPLRIDFILAGEQFEIDQFVNYSQKYSDHYPVMAKVSW